MGDNLTRRDVPNNELTVAAAGDQSFGVWTEPHAGDLFAPMSAQRAASGLAGFKIPEPHGPIVAASGREPTVGSKLDPIHLVWMSKNVAWLSRERVPDSGRAILAGRGEATPVGREPHAVDLAAFVAQGHCFAVRESLEISPLETAQVVRAGLGRPAVKDRVGVANVLI